MDFVRDQFLTRPGLPQDENGGFSWRHHFDLPNELAKDSTLAYQIAEGFGLNDFLLQIGIVEFQLRLETLDFLEGTCVGNSGTYVVTEELAPWTSFLANFGPQIPSHNSQHLVLETDSRAIESHNTLSRDPNRIGQPLPVPSRLVQDDSSSGRRALAQKTCPHGYCVRRFAQSGRKAASGSSQTQATLCFINKPDLNARGLGGLLDAPRDDFIQQILY